VGFFRSARYPAERGGRYVAEVAAWQEYGTRIGKGRNRQQHIPPRPFIRPGKDAGQKDVRKVLLSHLDAKTGAVVTPEIAGLCGLKMQEAIQNAIDAVTSPPLTASTLRRRRKNSSKPLIDEGVLRQSVTWKLIQ